MFIINIFAVPMPKEIIFPTQPPTGLQVTWQGCKEADGCNVEEKLNMLVPYFRKVAAYFRPLIAISLLPQGKKMTSLEDPKPETVTLPEEPPEGSGLTVKVDDCSSETGCNVRTRNREIGQYFNILASHFSRFVPCLALGPHNPETPVPVREVNARNHRIPQPRLTATHKDQIRQMLNNQNKQIFEQQKQEMKQLYDRMAGQQMQTDEYHKYIQKVVALEERRQEMFSNYMRTRNQKPHFEFMYDSPTTTPSTGNKDDRILEIFGGNYFTPEGYILMKKRHLENLGIEGYGKEGITIALNESSSNFVQIDFPTGKLF